MADTPAQVALDEREETPAEEFSRLIIEFNEGERQNRAEAWNLIADFACEHADTIIRALSPLSDKAGDDGQGALVERARYFVENPSAWESGFDQGASDRLAEILAAYEALTRENAALLAAKSKGGQADG